MNDLRRYVTWFSRVTDELMGEETLRGVEADDLRELLHTDPLDPLYDCYPVTADERDWVQQHIQHRIRLDRYDYFIEAEAVTAHATSSSAA